MEIKEIIERIAYFRNIKNTSARALSENIGKSSNYINRLESLCFNIPTSVLLEIIDTLGISPEEFFASNYKSYKKDSELCDLIKNMSVEKKNSLIDLIKHM